MEEKKFEGQNVNQNEEMPEAQSMKKRANRDLIITYVGLALTLIGSMGTGMIPDTLSIAGLVIMVVGLVKTFKNKSHLFKKKK